MAEERLGASFSIDTTALKAGLAQANRLIRESQSAFENAAAGVDDFGKSQEGLEAKIKHLNNVQDLQQKKVDGLRKAYQENIDKGLDPMSASMVKLRTDINKEETALKKTKSEIQKQTKALDELENASDEAGEAVQNAGRFAEKAGDGFTVGKGAIAGFISDGLSSLVSACGDAISSIAGLAEETREYREDLGKLQTAFLSAGKTTELATATYKDFYSVLGEEDRSIEAVNHLAKFVETEQDMTKWTNIAAGVWGTFGDSLPIEGLTEASNETAKTGQITGVLADALNWAAKEGETYGVALKKNIDFTRLSEKELQKLSKSQREEYEARKKQSDEIDAYNKKVQEAASAEDYFNLALQSLNSEQERAQFITETLNSVYSEAADTYKETNSSVIEARKANSDYTDSMAELGAELEPVNMAVSEMKNEFIKGLSPALKKDVIPQVKSFVGELKESGTVEKFSKSVSNIAKKVLPPLTKAVKFAAENIETIAGVTLTAVTAFTAFNAAMKVSAAITTATAAVKGLTAGAGLATKAQTVWNAVMSANPIGAVITAVGLLAGGIALLVNKEKEATESTDLLSESQRNTVTATNEAAEAYRDTKAAADELAGSQIANVDYVQNNLLPALQNVVDANGKVKEGEEGRAQFILNELNNALGTEYEKLSDVVDANGQIKDSIYEVIEAKKAQILLEAYEESYRQAIEKVAEAEKTRATQAQEVAKQQEVYQEAEKKYAEAYAEYARKTAEAKSDSDYRKLASEGEWINKLKAAKDEEKTKLDEVEAAYSDSESALFNYYKDIADYETASTLVMEGETAKALNYLNNLGSGFETVASTAKLSADEQKKVLEQQVIDTEVNAILMREAYEKGVEGVTEDMVLTAEEQAEKAKEQFKAVGGDITKGMAEGAEEEEWTLTGAMKSLIEKAVKAAKKAAQSKSPSKRFKKQVGVTIPQGIAVGIDDGTSDVIKSVNRQVNAIERAYDVGAINAKVNSSVNVPKNTTQNNNTGVAVGGGVTVNQTNYYSQAHSRYELYKSKQQTAAAVKLAVQGV